jgi:hypothetical protein
VWTEAEEKRIIRAYLANGVDGAQLVAPSRSRSAIYERLTELRGRGELVGFAKRKAAKAPSVAPATAGTSTLVRLAGLDRVPDAFTALPWVKWPSGDPEALSAIERTLLNARSVAVENDAAKSVTDWLDQNVAYARALRDRCKVPA